MCYYMEQEKERPEQVRKHLHRAKEMLVVQHTLSE